MKPWITTRIPQASVREDARKCRKETIMVAVLSNTDVALMPTSSCRARILLRSKRAEIVGYHPFTIRLLDRETGNTQPIEYKSDTGSVYVGVSICSEKHEYISEERILLDDEKKKHDNCRTLRRTRRNRLRYRKPRFDNREKAKGWIAPTLQNNWTASLISFTLIRRSCRSHQRRSKLENSISSFLQPWKVASRYRKGRTISREPDTSRRP